MNARRIAVMGVVCWAAQLAAQQPVARSIRILPGDREGGIRLLREDTQGMLWLAGEHGLFHSDGARSRMLLPLDTVRATALAAHHTSQVALSNGTLLRCGAMGCDTLLFDTALRRTPVTALLEAADGTVWCGTYGAGLRSVGRPGGDVHIAQELGDAHVNALVACADGSIAVGTDQGVAFCDQDGRVVQRITEADGLPDNLVLALDVDVEGTLWVGTHQSGVCAVQRSGGAPVRIRPVTPEWDRGPVHALVQAGGRVWAATSQGLLAVDGTAGPERERTWPVDTAGRVVDVMRAADGAVWWSNGSGSVGRASVDAVHWSSLNGVDLMKVTALSASPGGGVQLATPTGVIRMDRAPGAEAHVMGLRTAPGRPVVALHAAADGSTWAGTFGDGVMRRWPDGRVGRYDLDRGLCNPNVLALDGGPAPSGVSGVWAATLGGVCVYDPALDRFTTVAIPGSGFVYDILSVPDGQVFAATDGSGLVRIGKDGAVRIPGIGTHASFYALCRDRHGTVWATGPDVDLCRVVGDSLQAVVMRADLGDVFGLAPYADGVVLLAQGGLWYVDRAGEAFDLAPALGWGTVEAELNTLCTTDDGALWVGCDKGLFRLWPDVARKAIGPRALVLERRSGDLVHEAVGHAQLPHDRNFITFRFAAPYFGASPGERRFAYRLVGQDTTVRVTADDEVSWTRLAPGDYRFELRAIADGREGPWVVVPFTVARPWWRAPEALVTAALLLSVLFYLFLRARERRLNSRERVRREKAQAELAALRSQVNPHFLFNSFNTLLALVEEDPARAARHVEQLSDFFREILQLSDKDLVTLHEDLRMARTYFDLEQRRFGDRIRLQVEVGEEALAKKVPPMTLQLLVENAIKHNIATDARPLTIAIHATAGRLEVVNTLQPRPTEQPSTGFGLPSIRQRFAELSSVPVDVTTHGATFRVRLPLIDP